jgi:hypothetical protein
MPITIETDENGCPVIRRVIEFFVGRDTHDLILTLQFAENPDEFERGGRRIQFVFHPQTAQDLAATLQDAIRGLPPFDR